RVSWLTVSISRHSTRAVPASPKAPFAQPTPPPTAPAGCSIPHSCILYCSTVLRSLVSGRNHRPRHRNQGRPCGPCPRSGPRSGDCLPTSLSNGATAGSCTARGWTFVAGPPPRRRFNEAGVRKPSRCRQSRLCRTIGEHIRNPQQLPLPVADVDVAAAVVQTKSSDLAKAVGHHVLSPLGFTIGDDDFAQSACGGIGDVCVTRTVQRYANAVPEV